MSDIDPPDSADAMRRAQFQLMDRITELEKQNADLTTLNAHLEAEASNIAARQLQTEAKRDEFSDYLDAIAAIPEVDRAAGGCDEAVRNAIATLKAECDEAKALVQTWVDIAQSEKKSVLTTQDRMRDLRAFKERLARVRALLDTPERLDVAALKEALK